MNAEVKKLVAQAVVQYLNGDMEKFEKWRDMAVRAYETDKHLYVTIRDILENKGLVG